jgi:hypothetical protein
MPVRFIHIFLLLACTAPALQAQTYFSRKLAEIGELFPYRCLPETDSIFYCGKILVRKPLVVKYNLKNEIEHLGVSLFSRETKEMINLPICNFVERIMLELVLQKTKAEAVETLTDYQVQLKKNKIEYGKAGFTSIRNVLENISQPVRFTILKETNYTVIWEYGNELLSMSFPASRKLIFGTDKKESDEELNSRLLLSNYTSCQSRSPEIIDYTEETFTPDIERKIVIRKGKSFLSKIINNDTYFIKSDDQYKLLLSKEYPEESLSNLIIENLENPGLKLNITHRMYGFFSPDFEIELKDFICYFKDNFNFYTASSGVNAGILKLTVVIHNTDFNYAHLLLITTPVENLFQENGIIKADFYSNIPQHNIKNLYADKE